MASVGATVTLMKRHKPRKGDSDKIDWAKIDPDEVLTITLLRPPFESLVKQIRRRSPQTSPRRKSKSTHEKQQ
jgi:hypothetical protein